jgi:hypothetical protein
MIVQSRLDGVYGGLTPDERARLMASINRTGAEGVMQKIRTTVPDSQAAHYNHRLAILRMVHRPLIWNLIALLLAAERDGAGMRLALMRYTHRRMQHINLSRVWQLVPYPVTQREFAVIQAIEHDRPYGLDAFAQFMVQTNSAEEAAVAGWRDEVVSFLRRDDPEDDDAWQRMARALLDAAIARGELPAPTMVGDGPALPWGVLETWLDPTGAHDPYPPSYHVPTVELLGGGVRDRWDIRPDTEAPAVEQRREDIAGVLFPMAGLEADAWPSLHPPASYEEQTAAREQIERAWPWTEAHEEATADLTSIGTHHAPWRAKLAAHHVVLDEVRREDFCGEEPVADGIRELPDLADAEHQTVQDLWATAGDVLCADPWPPFPEVASTVADEDRTYYRALYRALE